MPFLTRFQLQEYMIKEGENWILSYLHNRPHDYMAANSDILKARMDALSGKLGLSPSQEKLDGFPIYQGAYFIKTGNTFVEALSILDRQIKELEDWYRLVLYEIASRGAADWIVVPAQEPLTIISDTVSNPAPLYVADFGPFVWAIYPGNSKQGIIYRTNDIEAGWSRNSLTVEDIFGVAYSLEKHAVSILLPLGSSTALLLCGANHEVQSTSYQYYLKRATGTVDNNTSSITFDSTGSSYPSTYIIKTDIGAFTRYLTSAYVNNKYYIYIMPTTDERDSYLLNRDQRLVKVSDIQIIQYDELSGGYDDLGRLYIEGTNGNAEVEFISSMEIKKVGDDLYNMILADENGDIVFRESSDGLNWYALSGAANDGIVQAAPVGYNLDYPTFIPISTGYLAFYNSNYQDGVLDNIYYAESRDGGLNWTTPGNQLGITGIFPQIIKTRNGGVYLMYWDSKGVELLRLFISTKRTYTAGG